MPPLTSSLLEGSGSVGKLLLWLIFYPMPGHLALWSMLGAEGVFGSSNLGLQKIFFVIYFFQTETLPRAL